MNNKDLKKIIGAIQKGEGIKIKAIAENAIINRSYLSSLINSRETKEVEDPLIGKIRKAYPAYFDQQKPTERSKIDEILASLTLLQGYTISILTGQSAGHEVIMGALDRLEKNPEGSLSSAADKLAIQLAERLSIIQTGKKDGVHK
jgi:hypothetical protein